jgi:hypothetical protein
MWLDDLVKKSAWELEVARKTVFQFGAAVTQSLDKMPIQEWEAALWARGLKTGLLRLEGYFFRAGAGKRSALSFFVRNDSGAYVGLRRESVTQAATYVSLVTEYSYPRQYTRFESQWMDVAVYDDGGSAWIYAENKANQKVLEKLCGRLANEFLSDIPTVDLEEKRVDDAVMKANHIWRHRPRYFWAVAPTLKNAFEIQYSKTKGFGLKPLASLPSHPRAI